MNTTAIQGVIWLVAGGAIYLFLRRRRTRRDSAVGSRGRQDEHRTSHERRIQWILQFREQSGWERALRSCFCSRDGGAGRSDNLPSMRAGDDSTATHSYSPAWDPYVDFRID